MPIRITTLSENTAGMGDFLGEWGLSILVETDEVTVLLDTGKGFSATYNADSLGVDLRRIDKLILSHGHYDHTGGLPHVLRKVKKQVKVIAHPDIWQVKYSRRSGKPDRYIGIPFQRSQLESLGATFHLTAEPVKITENVMTTGGIPMLTNYELIDKALLVQGIAGLEPDELADDQALIIKEENGLVVILGCAHCGMINTLYHAQRLTGISKIYAVVGGSHLIGASEERLRRTVDALRQLRVQKLGLCHCTDLPAVTLLAREFPGEFFFNKAGSIVVL